MTPTYLWLIAGVLLSLAELHFTGIGLLFAGLGAVTAGSALWLGLVNEEAQVAQWLIFFLATAFWVVLLWRPMQRFRHRSPGYHNIIGDIAYVGSQGITKHSGEVTWSGTIMKAHLAKNVSVEKLEAGTQVAIIEVKGATLIVKPKE